MFGGPPALAPPSTRHAFPSHGWTDRDVRATGAELLVLFCRGAAHGAGVVDRRCGRRCRRTARISRRRRPVTGGLLLNATVTGKVMPSANWHPGVRPLMV